MKLTNEEREAIIAFRIQKAFDTLNEAEGIASLDYWNTVANRLYYACYYVTSALLIKYNFSARTHIRCNRFGTYVYCQRLLRLTLRLR